MDEIPILYKCENDDSYNCFMYRSMAGKEVWLQDILSCWIVHGIDICFMYYASTGLGDEMILLQASSSVVPIRHDGTIVLLLKQSAAPPVIPIGQANIYAHNSRSKIYSKSTAKSAVDQVERIVMLHSRNQGDMIALLPSSAPISSPSKANVSTGRDPFADPIDFDDFGTTETPRNSSHETSARLPAFKESPTKTPSKSTNSSTVRKHETAGRPAPYSDSDHVDSTLPKKPSTFSGGLEKLGKGLTSKAKLSFGSGGGRRDDSRTGSSGDIPDRSPASEAGAGGIQNLVSEETVTAITDAAGAVGRSFMSFAALSLKSVVEVASSTGVGIQTIQVGNTHVIVVRDLAEGGFGTVSLVEDAGNKRQYAMKRMLCQTKEQVEDANNELKALNMFAGSKRSPYIISLLDFSSNPGKTKNIMKEVHMLFPLFPHGTAWDAVERAVPRDMEGSSWPFPEKRALQVVLGTARGLLCLHEKGYSHRDVKPHNVLLAEDGSPVLMDLGSVTTARVDVRTRQQALAAEEEAASKTSAPYRSPELTSTSHPILIDERVDVWGLGCTMFCLAFGHSPFESVREGVLRLAILNGRYTVPTGRRMRSAVFSEGYVDLIQQMLLVDISRRPFLPEAIETLQELIAGVR